MTIWKNIIILTPLLLLGTGCNPTSLDKSRMGDDLISLSESNRLHQECETFGKDFIKKNISKNLFEKNSSQDFFYSKRLDTCVMTSFDELGFEYGIYDIKQNYIKKELKNPAIMGSLFFCDKSGVDNVILEKAEQYNGELFEVSYKEYLDNGEGGAPRTLMTPEKPYTKEHCENLYNKKLSEIK